MQKSTADGSSFDDERAGGDAEIQIGDADSVQKTTYVVGRGTDPSALEPDARARRADAPPKRGEAGNG